MIGKTSHLRGDNGLGHAYSRVLRLGIQFLLTTPLAALTDSGPADVPRNSRQQP